MGMSRNTGHPGGADKGKLAKARFKYIGRVEHDKQGREWERRSHEWAWKAI